MLKNCGSCEQIENIEHLIYGCSETKRIWEKVSGILKWIKHGKQLL